MKKTAAFLWVYFFTLFVVFGHQPDTTHPAYLNTVETMLQKDGNLLLGGYGEVHYNQPLDNDTKELGVLDVHRIVMFLGYNFSAGTQFVSEIEFEHANEIWIEQAFLQHRVNKYINLRAGLLLIPMGIINEYHEPPTFNGVERPVIDYKITPTTWREIGFGLSGSYLPLSIRYQAYIVNGLNGYDSKGVLNGTNGLRSGRQKGSNAYMSSPNYTGKVEYFGLKNLNIGLSGYFGNSQSRIYNNIHRDSLEQITRADSSVVFISMGGADFRYNVKGLELRGQFYYAAFSNTGAYNRFTAQNGIANDLGSSMLGYYLEAGYNLFRHFETIKTGLVPFIRYERYNTHLTVDPSIEVNELYNNTVITTGLTYRLTRGAVAKADLQFFRSGAGLQVSKVFNAGVGVMF
jgi:hypothetical protein